MIEVTGPDGAIIRFPAGTPQEVITRVMRERYGGPQEGAPAAPAPSDGPSPSIDMDAPPIQIDGRWHPAGTTAEMIAHMPEGFFYDPSTGQYRDVNTEAQLRDRNALDAAIGGAMQGSGFQFGDEVIGSILGLTGGPAARALETERVRAQLEQDRADHPVASIGAEIAGSIVPALAYSPSLAGQGLGRQTLTMAGVGAAEGALHGFGAGEDGFMSRLGNAGAMGAAGGLLGAVAPGVVTGAQAIARPVTGAVRSALGIGSETRAADYLARIMTRAGTTMDDLTTRLRQAGADGQDVYTAADAMGNAGQRALTGIARTPGIARQAVHEALMDRQMGQADRVGGYLSDALNLSSDTAAQIRAAAEAEQRGVAAVNYPAAEAAAQPVDITGALAYIDSRLGPADQAGIRATNAGQRLLRYRSMLEVPPARLPPGAHSMELSDFASIVAVKSQLADDISALLRAGRNSEASQLIPLRDALDSALEGSSPLYRQANDTYRAQSAAIGAIDEGRDAARIAMRPEDAVRRYGEQSTAAPSGQGGALASQQEGFRIGYGDHMLTRLGDMTATSNAALPFNRPRQHALMGEMASDPDLWQRRLQRELEMYETNRAATGGSMTADNLNDGADLAGNVGMAANVATGHFGAVAQALLSRFGHAASGMDDATRQMVARALLSRDPQAEIAALLQRANVTGQQRRAVEAFLRHSGYQGLSVND